MIDLSVIVCCYNSAHLLKDTLTYLARQQVTNGFNYEVVLVDNNSTDNTAEIAVEIWKSLNVTLPLYVVKEPKSGLAYARETGVKECQGGIVVFCDDDNWLQYDYLQIAYDFMMSHPEVGALGGQSVGVLEGDAPLWWEGEKRNYAVGKQAMNSGDVTQRGYVWGAGLVSRLDVLLKLYNSGFKTLLTGRKGRILASGDDSELCKWFILMGCKLWYLEALEFKHFITKKRLTDVYLEKLLAGHLASQDMLDLYNWFIKISKKYQKKSGYSRFNKSIKLILKGILKRESMWREKLQIELGTLYKIHPTLYEICKTFKTVNKNID